MKKLTLINAYLIIYSSLSFGQVGQIFSCTSNDSINLNLVLCLPFNGNASDESGNGYNGTANGAILIADRFGHSNRAYGFDGVSNYISLAKLLPDQSYLSISVWIHPSGDSTTYGDIFFEGDANCGNDIGLIYWNKTIRLMATKSGASLNGITSSAQATLTSNSFNGWYHVVWTMSPTQSKIYLNGNLASIINSTGSNIGFHYTPTIGCFNDGGGAPCGSQKASFFQGGIDDIRVYSRVLTLNEIIALYNFVYTDIPVIEEKLKLVTIYPNPSQGKLIIATNLETDKSIYFEFYDMLGKQIMQSEITRFNSTVEIGDFNSGIYIVVAKFENIVNVQKIILTK